MWPKNKVVSMNDERKTKKQLIAQLEALRGELGQKDDELDALRQQVPQGEVSSVKRRLAVERVRAEAMAMRSSKDLLKVVGTILWTLSKRPFGQIALVVGIGVIFLSNWRPSRR